MKKCETLKPPPRMKSRYNADLAIMQFFIEKILPSSICGIKRSLTVIRQVGGLIWT
jgi:hypothetical protein